MKSDSFSIKYIKLSEIDSNPINEKIFSVSNIEGLAKLIAEEGLRSAIEVYQKDDGRYEIISGHRRYAAMKMLQSEEIPCIVSNISNPDEIKKRLVSSNLSARVTTPMEMAYAIHAYREALAGQDKKEINQTSRQQIAEYFGMSESKVTRYEALLKLIPELQNLCKNPSFQYSALQKAVTLTPEEQKMLYEKLLETQSRNKPTIKTSIDVLNSKEKHPQEPLVKYEYIDDIDTGDLIISRTIVENIIQGIKNKPKQAPKPIVRKTVTPKDDVSGFKVREDVFIIKDTDEEEKVYTIDDINNFSSSTNAVDYNENINACILKLMECKKIADSDKPKFKERLQELKDLIETLEIL